MVFFFNSCYASGIEVGSTSRLRVWQSKTKKFWRSKHCFLTFLLCFSFCLYLFSCFSVCSIVFPFLFVVAFLLQLNDCTFDGHLLLAGKNVHKQLRLHNCHWMGVGNNKPILLVSRMSQFRVDGVTSIRPGREPWSNGYGRRLMVERLWV